jgi:hypothetical protein
MLSREASSPTHPRVQRSRRLYAVPAPRLPGAAPRGALSARAGGAATSKPATTPAALTPSERWSVRLELAGDDVARLYGQGLARGALVWKKGMVEWRPLLITPELTGLLKRTSGVASATPPSRALPSEPATAPRSTALAQPALDFRVAEPAPVLVATATAAPAREPGRAVRRLRYDVALVALASFALAWFVRAALAPEPTASTPPPAAAPVAPTTTATTLTGSAPRAASNIPVVAVGDLPILRGSGAPGAGRGGTARAEARGAEGPSRAALVNALSRVAASASACGPREGAVRVVMTFAPSGVARSIKVSGQGLPGGTRSCIVAAAARARVPAFQGEPITVGKTL